MQLSPADAVDPFAKILVSSYVGAVAEARSFTAEWQSPPTRMHKVHSFRSIVQAQVNHSDRYTLHPEYSEAGRVQVTDHETDESYLIRSMTMVDIDRTKNLARQLTLFEVSRKPTSSGLPDMLAYDFERKGMTLWISSTKQASADGRRLVPAGRMELLGFWPFADTTSTPPPDGGKRFDQGGPDLFDELGNPDIDDLGEAGGL